MEKCDVSKHESLNDFLYAVCSKLGLDYDGDFLNSSFGTFVINAKYGYIVRTDKKEDCVSRQAVLDLVADYDLKEKNNIEKLEGK